MQGSFTRAGLAHEPQVAGLVGWGLTRTHQLVNVILLRHGARRGFHEARRGNFKAEGLLASSNTTQSHLRCLRCSREGAMEGELLFILSDHKGWGNKALMGPQRQRQIRNQLSQNQTGQKGGWSHPDKPQAAVCSWCLILQGSLGLLAQ